MEAEFKESGVIGLFDVYLTLRNKVWPPLFGVRGSTGYFGIFSRKRN